MNIEILIEALNHLKKNGSNNITDLKYQSQDPQDGGYLYSIDFKVDEKDGFITVFDNEKYNLKYKNDEQLSCVLNKGFEKVSLK